MWQQVSLASVAVFAAILAAVTGAELALGTPLSDLLRGKHASGTTLLGSTAHTAAYHAATSVVTMTVTPSVVITTPTVTQTAPAVTATTTPTVTSTATPTPPASDRVIEPVEFADARDVAARSGPAAAVA